MLLIGKTHSQFNYVTVVVENGTWLLLKLCWRVGNLVICMKEHETKGFNQLGACLQGATFPKRTDSISF